VQSVNPIGNHPELPWMIADCRLMIFDYRQEGLFAPACSSWR
jgi:hypothetical protein